MLHPKRERNKAVSTLHALWSEYKTKLAHSAYQARMANHQDRIDDKQKDN